MQTAAITVFFGLAVIVWTGIFNSRRYIRWYVVPQKQDVPTMKRLNIGMLIDELRLTWTRDFGKLLFQN